ncbi:unnamed protein product [Diamesa tonsa]
MKFLVLALLVLCAIAFALAAPANDEVNDNLVGADEAVFDPQDPQATILKLLKLKKLLLLG